MTKDEAVILLCEHFSEGMVRTIVDAIAKDEVLQLALEALTDFDYDKRIKAIESIKEALKTKDEQRTWVGLTDEEIESVYMNTMNFQQNAKALETKLKEKNT